MSSKEETLGRLVKNVLSSAKYKQIGPALVRTIGERELEKGATYKVALKATKNKLHQIGGAYQPQRIDYDRALQQLNEATSPAAWQQASCEIMSLHASTRERLPILDSFYGSVLAGIPAPRRVLDIASGLNPLAIPWMPLAADVTYVAYDIYRDMMGFLQAVMQRQGINGRAEVRDVTHDPPSEPVDLAFLLKTLPCLEQLQKGTAERLLDTIQARYLLISYPVASLGGRRKGMADTYEEQFQTLVSGRNWTWQRFLFDSELAFLVDTRAAV